MRKSLRGISFKPKSPTPMMPSRTFRWNSGDVRPSFAEVPYAFIGAKALLSKAEVIKQLQQVSVNVDEQSRILDLLLWFGFLGIHVYPDAERYSYNFKYDLKRMKSGLPERFGYHPSSLSHRPRLHLARNLRPNSVVPQKDLKDRGLASQSTRVVAECAASFLGSDPPHTHRTLN